MKTPVWILSTIITVALSFGIVVSLQTNNSQVHIRHSSDLQGVGGLDDNSKEIPALDAEKVAYMQGEVGEGANESECNLHTQAQAGRRDLTDLKGDSRLEEAMAIIKKYFNQCGPEELKKSVSLLSLNDSDLMNFFVDRIGRGPSDPPPAHVPSLCLLILLNPNKRNEDLLDKGARLLRDDVSIGFQEKYKAFIDSYNKAESTTWKDYCLQHISYISKETTATLDSNDQGLMAMNEEIDRFMDSILQRSLDAVTFKKKNTGALSRASRADLSDEALGQQGATAYLHMHSLAMSMPNPSARFEEHALRTKQIIDTYGIVNLPWQLRITVLRAIYDLNLFEEYQHEVLKYGHAINVNSFDALTYFSVLVRVLKSGMATTKNLDPDIEMHVFNKETECADYYGQVKVLGDRACLSNVRQVRDRGKDILLLIDTLSAQSPIPLAPHDHQGWKK